MNNVQLKYTRARAENILASKLRDLRNKYTVVAKYLTPGERAKAYKKGEYTVEAVDQGYCTDYLVLFKGETHGSFDSVNFNKEEKAIKDAFHKLMDELILGDNEKAMAMLKEFEK